MIAAEPGGEVVTFRSTGCGRYGTATFLLVWLCGWVVGEGAAGAALLVLLGVVPEAALPQAVQKLAHDTAVQGGAATFLVVWFVFWTFGGLLAIWFLIRLLFGVDRIHLKADGLTLETKPFGKTRFFPRDSLAFVTIKPSGGGVSLETKGTDGARSIVLTALGTPADREALRDLVRERYHLPRERPGFETTGPRSAAVLPAAFEEFVDERGDLVVRRTRKGQRQVAGCAWVVAAIAATGFMGWALSPSAEHVGVPAVLVSLVILGALWCSFAREYWIVRRGYLEDCLSFAVWSRRRPATDATLVIKVSKDSDDDVWYELRVQAAITDASFRLTNSINDPSEPVALGRYLAERTGFRFEVPPEAKI